MSNYEHKSIVNANDELETVTNFEPKPGDALESRGFRSTAALETANRSRKWEPVFPVFLDKRLAGEILQKRK